MDLPVAPVEYLASGVSLDCERMLKKLDVYNHITLEEFTQIWKEMKFRHIYYGRRSFIDLMEFTEEVLIIAKKLWLEPNPLPKRVNRFFLLAALYLKQIFKNPTFFIKIRLAVTELEELNKFCDEAQAEGFRDISKLLEQLYLNNAFSFHGKRREYALEYEYRTYLLNDFDKSRVRREESIDEIFQEGGLYDQLKLNFSNYHQTKLINYGTPPEGLTFIDANSCEELCSIGTSGSIFTEASSAPQVETIEQRRKGIRDRSYRRKCNTKLELGSLTDSDASDDEKKRKRT